MAAGNVEAVQVMCETRHPVSGELCPWDDSVLMHATGYGLLPVAQYLRSERVKRVRGEKCPWSEAVIARAANHGNRDLILFLRSEEATDDDGARCPWGPSCVRACVRGRSSVRAMQALRSREYAAASGGQCPWDESVWPLEEMRLWMVPRDLAQYMMSADAADPDGSGCPISEECREFLQSFGVL